MNKFLLGIATGVGVAYFFNSSTGKRWLESAGEKITGIIDRGEDLLIDATDGLEVVREKVVEKTKQTVS